MTRSDDFDKLRSLELHKLKSSEWEAYYEDMKVWLTYDDPDIRFSCSERLCTAAFWADKSKSRALWLTQQIETAAETYPDIRRHFLYNFRFSYPYKDIERLHVKNWLLSVSQQTDQTLADMARGTLILHNEPNMAHLFKALDDGSDYVRCCAAFKIGQQYDEADMSLEEIFDFIGAKELQRPGIAGAFWSGTELGWDMDEITIDPIDWMMTLLEKRPDNLPQNMPYNDITFHLHELGSQSGETAQRMMEMGHYGLALQTACDDRENVPSMQPVLMELGYNPDDMIARQASRHLASYYAILHPGADKDYVKEIVLTQQARAFAVRYGDLENWREAVIFYPASPADRFNDELAWKLIDSIAPPDKRGELVHDYLADKSGPPQPYELGNTLLYSYASKVRLTLVKHPETGWRRLEILGPDLGQFQP